MKNTFWYSIGLVLGAILCIVGASQALSPVPTTPTCSGQQMMQNEICDRTVNGFKMRYDYNEKLQLDRDNHDASIKNWGWYVGIGVILILGGIYTLSNESRKRRVASGRPIYRPGRRPPALR